MSVFYAAAYRIGFRPWETAAKREADRISELFEREESGRQQPFGPALDLGRGAACSRSRWRGVQDRRWTGLEVLEPVVAEFRRARAAEQRYEQLRRAGAAAVARDGSVPADIPRRLFDEFYSSTIENREAHRSKRESAGWTCAATTPQR